MMEGGDREPSNDPMEKRQNEMKELEDQINKMGAKKHGHTFTEAFIH